MTPTHLILAQSAEAAAAEFLVSGGWVVLARNWHCRGGELDIICRKRDTIAFVEVRSTSNPNPLVLPQQTVGVRKQARVVHAAKRWLVENPSPRTVWRFDIIAAYKDPSDGFALVHVPNAFQPPAM